jgi:signal peptidase I
MKQSVYNAVKFTGVVAARAYMGVIIGLILLSVAPLLVQWHPTIVTSGSMEPNVMTGDIIAAEPVSQDSLKAGGVTVGQVLLADNPAQPGHLYTHRITRILPDNAGYITKGDANVKEDATPLPIKNVVGIEKLRVPYAGLPIQKLRNGDIFPAVFFGILTIVAQLIIMKDNKETKLADASKDIDKGDGGNKPTPRPKSGRRRAPTTNTLNLSALATLILAVVFPVTGSSAAFSGYTAPITSGFSANAAFPTPAVSNANLRFGLATSSISLDEVDMSARNVNEYPSMVSTYNDFTNLFDMNMTNAIIAKGALPVITWEPFNAANGVTQPEYKLSTITSGAHDAYIGAVANQLIAAGNPTIAIRFAHEMNGNWYPWSEQVNGNAPGEYVQAWRHVVDLFRAQGVTNVQWVWAPNTQMQGVSTAALYPGSAYVDYTGIDGFNWGSDQPWTGGWQNPWDVLDSSMTEIAAIAPDKNMIVTETASVESENGHSKAQWITDAIYYFDHWGDSRSVKIAGFIWFDINKENDWRIASSPESSAAMRAALANRR